ncbi:MAG: PIN domain-containing protein [Sandaracinaceae bacterium]|nr:PIN domain-containing protein [Sandaracinaceae bacterium]
MIAVDTNLLVYAHRGDSEWNERAYAALAELATGSSTWAIPWPCVHEFLSIATHPRIYDPPSTAAQAIDQLEAWMASPSLALLAEEGLYWPALTDVLRAAKVSGPRVHDARIAALCRIHGVRELWTADRDFGRFPALVTRNPLIA